MAIELMEELKDYQKTDAAFSFDQTSKRSEIYASLMAMDWFPKAVETTFERAGLTKKATARMKKRKQDQSQQTPPSKPVDDKLSATGQTPPSKPIDDGFPPGIFFVN